MKNPVFDIDNWKEITATLGRNKTRTFLTAFGIFWGTAMLAMLWGGAQGFQDLLRRNFAGFSTNTALVFAGNTSIPYKGFSKGMWWSLTQTDIDNMRKSIPEISASSAVTTYSTTAIHGAMLPRYKASRANILLSTSLSYMRAGLSTTPTAAMTVRFVYSANGLRQNCSAQVLR